MKFDPKSIIKDIGEFPWYRKIVVGSLLLYLASPIDLIPDFIPVLGQMDDALVLAFLLKYIKKHRKTIDLSNSIC